MSQSTSNLKITQKMSPLLPLAGLPRRKLTAAEMQIAAARVKEQTEQRVKLGSKLFSAAESHTVRTQKLINELKADQDKFAKLLRGDVAKTLRSYDRWMGKLDDHLTEEVAKLNHRLGAMEVKWSQAEDRLKKVTTENENLIKQMGQGQQRHQEQTKRLMINTFKSLIEKNAFQAKPVQEEVVVKEAVCITDSMSLAEINAMKPTRVGPGQRGEQVNTGQMEMPETTADDDSGVSEIEPLQDAEFHANLKFDELSDGPDDVAWMQEESELNLKLTDEEAEEDIDFNLTDTSWQYDFDFDDELEINENQATELRNMATKIDDEDTTQEQPDTMDEVAESETSASAQTNDTVSESALKAAENASLAASLIAEDFSDDLDGKVFDDTILENTAEIINESSAQSKVIASEIQNLLQTNEAGPGDEFQEDNFQELIHSEINDTRESTKDTPVFTDLQNMPLSEQLTESGVKQLLLDMLSDADVVAKLRNEQVSSDSLAEAANKESTLKQGVIDSEVGDLESLDMLSKPASNLAPKPAHHIYSQVRKWMNGD